MNERLRMSMIYYHNPRCTKSREGLKLLEESQKSFTIKEYLKEALTQKEIKELFENLNLEPLEAIRTKETIYKELGLKEKNLTKDQWAKIIVENPVLLERPILVKGKKAVIGRPVENLKKLI